MLASPLIDGVRETVRSSLTAFLFRGRCPRSPFGLAAKWGARRVSRTRLLLVATCEVILDVGVATYRRGAGDCSLESDGFFVSGALPPVPLRARCEVGSAKSLPHPSVFWWRRAR